MLRARQIDAVNAAIHGSLLLRGPPGTGKTFAVGALIARLLIQSERGRILLTGPTNIAVDNALLSADDWLMRLGRDDLCPSLKRLGTRLTAQKYLQREHLLAPGVASAATEVAILELEEPPKSEVTRYIRWKEKLERARSALKTNVAAIICSSRLIGITTASSFIWHEAVISSGKWDYLVCDEASQITLPAAVMSATFAARSVFAGDAEQLAPVVQNPAKSVQDILSKTAFDIFPFPKIKLNEQSRMCAAICDAVSNTFYDGELKVCSKAHNDPNWKKERSPWFVNGRELPRIMFEDCADEAKWSPKYNGFIRYGSAKIVETVTNELLCAYVSEKDILVLTPFRAQRALIRAMFKSGPLRAIRVSTVHRAQGSESKIVIFDPVDAASLFLNSNHGRRLINVAISRAQAHVIIVTNKKDRQNPWLAKVQNRSEKLWHRKGSFAEPLSFRR